MAPQPPCSQIRRLNLMLLGMAWRRGRHQGEEEEDEANGEVGGGATNGEVGGGATNGEGGGGKAWAADGVTAKLCERERRWERERDRDREEEEERIRHTSLLTKNILLPTYWFGSTRFLWYQYL